MSSESTSIDRTFRAVRDAFILKIEKQLEDIGQINIMTAVSDNLAGNVNPEAKSLLHFLEAEPNQKIEEKKLDGALLNILNEERLIDVKSLETPEITKTVSDLNATVLMRTILELDADIALILRSQEAADSNGERQIVSLDNDILAAHQANVNVAVQNWHFYVTTALQALGMIIDLAKQKPGE
jgi:hypothetical protein